LARARQNRSNSCRDRGQSETYYSCRIFIAGASFIDLCRFLAGSFSQRGAGFLDMLPLALFAFRRSVEVHRAPWRTYGEGPRPAQSRESDEERSVRDPAFSSSYGQGTMLVAMSIAPWTSYSAEPIVRAVFPARRVLLLGVVNFVITHGSALVVQYRPLRDRVRCSTDGAEGTRSRAAPTTAQGVPLDAAFRHHAACLSVVVLPSSTGSFTASTQPAHGGDHRLSSGSGW